MLVAKGVSPGEIVTTRDNYKCLTDKGGVFIAP